MLVYCCYSRVRDRMLNSYVSEEYYGHQTVISQIFLDFADAFTSKSNSLCLSFQLCFHTRSLSFSWDDKRLYRKKLGAVLWLSSSNFVLQTFSTFRCIVKYQNIFFKTANSFTLFLLKNVQILPLTNVVLKCLNLRQGCILYYYFFNDSWSRLHERLVIC